jgi:mannose-6-phosphate isomerase-like protein (cupin superfamily)
MNENLLKIHEFTGIGYKPLIDYGSWRVAILRYIDELIPDRIERVERHNETDEVFVLLAGRAILFIGEGDPELTELTPKVLEPGKLYNVKRCTWHNIVLSTDASILLVENCNTGNENSDHAALNSYLRRIIVETAAREQPDCWGDLL